MNFVERLLARASQKPATTRSGPVDPRIGAIINDAFAAAGMRRGDSPAPGVAGVIEAALERAGLSSPPAATKPTPAAPRLASIEPQAPAVRAGARPAMEQGQFLEMAFAGPQGLLDYKLYLPAGYDPEGKRAYPLVVMLHGCTQSPDDFAAGTRMNALVDQHGLLVAYPAQSAHANGSRCWNWFRAQDQARGAGEPALIAGMTLQVLEAHRVDPARVYVAGLSAGAAMAVVLGRTYPEIYAAVGAHSGLPYGAAHDVGSAFAAMHSGPRRQPGLPTGEPAGIPTIVFHGDRDTTVSPDNGGHIVAQATARPGEAPLATRQETGIAGGGRTFTRTEYLDADGRVLVEDWQVHGGGHAWMGGSASGSYTDPLGPDASAEMLRFFLRHGA